MAELLRRWLSQQVGVDIKGTLEQEFANGYKIGEVLHRCHLQPDFDKFIPNDKPDSLINNFTRLQPTLTNLGIKMDSNVANDIMTEKVGVAPKLIYAIKSIVDGLGNNLSASRTTKLGKTVSAETKPSAALLEAQGYRSEKLKKNSGDLRLFEQTMRTRAAPPNKVMEAMHLRKFEDEMIRQTRSAREGDLAERNDWLNARDSFRSGQLEKMSGKRQGKAQQTQADYSKHSQMLAKQNATELEELRVEMTLHQKRTAKLQSIRAKETAEVINGIDAYENNLRRIGSVGAADDGEDSTKLPPIGPTPYEHIQRVRAMAPAPDAYTLKSEKYLSSLHTKRRDEAAARKEREARRRRVLVEQQREQAEIEARAQVDMIVGTLQRESAEESRLAARLWQLQQEKAVMTENRALREQQYAERREADWRERLRREAELFRSQKEQYREEAELEMGLWQQREMAKADAKRRKHEQMCREIVWNVAGLAFRAAEYRETTGVSKVPRKEFRDWVAMFVAGDPALMEPLMKDDKLFHLPETANVVDEGNVADYLEYVGEWDAAKGIGFNVEVGRMVADLAVVGATPVAEEAIAEEEGEKSAEEAPDSQLEGLKVEVEETPADGGSRPGSKESKKSAQQAGAAEEEQVDAEEAEVDGLARDYPIKLAVTGAPFSGKSTVAAAMAAQLGLKVISPEGMVAQVVGAAKAVAEERKRAMEEWKAACAEAERLNNAAPPAPAPEDPNSVTEIVAMGREVATIIEEGEELNDDTVLRLILLGIRSLGPTAPLPVAEPPEPEPEPGDKKSKKDKKKEKEKKDDAKKEGGKKGGKGKKGEDVVEEPDAWMGYVLDGFPATKAQSVAFERALTGLDLAAEEAWLAAASRIAPPPPEYTSNLHRALHSGLDHVIVLGLGDEETVVKRAVGRRIDPETGVIYHLEFDPPPADQPGHTDKLAPVKDAAYDAIQVQERLATHVAEAPELDQWLGRFVKLRCGVDASVPAAEVTAAALKIADSLLKAKIAAAAANEGNNAATEALAAAEAARAQVVEAQGAVREAARNLLDAKKAELKAAAELAEDPAAAELMKGEASAACAEHVLAGNEALKAVQAAAERAEEAAAKARQAVEAAMRGITDTGLSAQSEITAKAAAEEAAQAAEEAEVAKAAAKQAATRAKEVFEDAVSRGEKADAMLAEEAAEAAALAADSKSGKGGKGGKSGKTAASKGKGGKGAKEEEELSPIEAVLTLPPEPEPEPEPEVPPKPEGLTPALGKLLHEQWGELEGNYLKGLSLLFASLREERTETVDHFVAVRKRFLEWLDRPDSRPAALAEFMTAFNAIAPDIRKRAEVMGELLLRADELRDALWDVCDSRLAENEDEQAAIVADSFVTDHTEITAAQIAALVQVELDRFTATLGVIQAYACAKSHVPGARQPRAHITAPDVSGDHPPHGLEAYFNPKSPFAWPVWITALDETAPKLGHALKVALASVNMISQSDPLPGLPSASGEEGGSVAGTPSAKPSKKNVGKEELTVDDTDYDLEDVAAARELAGRLVTREAELLQARLKLLGERGASYVTDLHANADHVHGQLQEWLRARYHSECSAVQAVHDHIRRAVQAGTPLPHDLRLEGETLVVDESTLSSAIVPPPPPAVRLPSDNLTAPPGVLSTAQLAALGAALAQVSPAGGFLPLSTAADVLQRVAATRLGDGSPGMPPVWLEADFTATATALRLFDPSASGYIDWRQLLVSLVAAAFPSIPTATVTDLANAAAALAASDGDNDGHVTKDELLATRLWFDTDGMDMAEREAAANGGGHPRADALKALLWEAFSADTGGLLPWRALLVHLCADHNLLAGLRKGFAALSGTPSEDARLRGKQVAALAYPLGAKAGVPLGRSPMSASEVADAVGKVAAARGASDGTVNAEQLMYSLGGGQLVSELLSWLQLKDPFSAIRR